MENNYLLIRVGLKLVRAKSNTIEAAKREANGMQHPAIWNPIEIYDWSPVNGFHPAEPKLLTSKKNFRSDWT